MWVRRDCPTCGNDREAKGELQVLDHVEPVIVGIGGPNDLYSPKVRGHFKCLNPDCSTHGAVQEGNMFWEGPCPKGRHFMATYDGRIIDVCDIPKDGRTVLSDLMQ